jgi:probable F420-dependent oxidoreductase
MADGALNDLGTYGVWVTSRTWPGAEKAAEIERLGFRALWLGSAPDDLAGIDELLAATDRLVVATGIVNIWTSTAEQAAAGYHRLQDRFPGRILLGIGAGHRESNEDYRKPYEALVDYLDELDRLEVPVGHRALAALGPKVLRLAADRTRGAHPYFVTPEYTRSARETLGLGPLLAVEHKLVIEPDPQAARAIARPTVARYLGLRNYVQNMKRHGWTDDDLAGDGSDALIDAVVAHGTASQVADRLREHVVAGADHVAAQVLPPSGDPVPALRELAAALELPGA